MRRALRPTARRTAPMRRRCLRRGAAGDARLQPGDADAFPARLWRRGLDRLDGLVVRVRPRLPPLDRRRRRRLRPRGHRLLAPAHRHASRSSSPTRSPARPSGRSGSRRSWSAWERSRSSCSGSATAWHRHRDDVRRGAFDRLGLLQHEPLHPLGLPGIRSHRARFSRPIRGSPGRRACLLVGVLLGVTPDIEGSILAVFPAVLLLLLWERRGRLERLKFFALGGAAGRPRVRESPRVSLVRPRRRAVRARLQAVYKLPLERSLRELSLSPIWDERLRYHFMTHGCRPTGSVSTFLFSDSPRSRSSALRPSPRCLPGTPRRGSPARLASRRPCADAAEQIADSRLVRAPLRDRSDARR